MYAQNVIKKQSSSQRAGTAIARGTSNNAFALYNLQRPDGTHGRRRHVRKVHQLQMAAGEMNHHYKKKMPDEEIDRIADECLDDYHAVFERLAEI